MTVAVIIGGGRSERMGTNKAELTLEGRTLMERAVDAVTDADVVVIVAPETPLNPARNWPQVMFTLENPPFGGPVAGLAAGVAKLSNRGDEEEVIVLPVDMPAVSDAAGELAAGTPKRDGVVLMDQSGHAQYLTARYRLGSLRRALGDLGTVRNVSMRRLGDLLEVGRVSVPNDLVADLDTPEQAAEFGIQVRPRKRRNDPEELARVEQWQTRLRGELGVDAAPCDVEEILSLADVVAKKVARPGVPVTGYVVGLAVGAALARGEDPEAAATRAIARAKELAEG